ncbi:MAG: hypothetical protein ACI89X_002445 [Planctomycetota bacterium]|jgi:hypothetical protein
MLNMRFLAALLCSTFLLAQAKSDPLRYVPKDADLVARAIGPAAWKRDYAATSLGKALADPQLLPIWVKLLALVEIQMVFEGEEQQFEQAGAIWNVLKDYSGDIVFAARTDWDAMTDWDARSGSDMWDGAVVMALGADGTCDLAKMAGLLGDKLPGEKAGEVEMGGVAATLREADSMQSLGPIVHEGHLVLLVGKKLEERARWFFEDAADKAATNELRKPSFALSLRCERAVKALIEAADLLAPPPAWFFVQFGLLSVKEFAISVSPDGKYVAQEMRVKFGDEPRGLLGMACPERMGKPDLLRYLPAGAGTYAVAPMDLSALVKVYEDVFTNHADELPLDRDDVEGMFADMTNLDLFKDVLAHIGDEYMRVDDLMAGLIYDEDEDEPEQVTKAKDKLGDACFVIKLKNGRAFGKNLDTAIRSRGLHVSRKREEYGDHNIYRMNLLGMFPFEYAVTDSLLLVGIGEGEGTKKNLRGVLDAVAAGDAEPTFSPEVSERLDGMPAGWGGIQVSSFVELLEGLVAIGESVDALLAKEGVALEDVEDPWQLIIDGSNVLKSVLARHKAGVAVNLDYFGKDRYVMRSRW